MGVAGALARGAGRVAKGAAGYALYDVVFGGARNIAENAVHQTLGQAFGPAASIGATTLFGNVGVRSHFPAGGLQTPANALIAGGMAQRIQATPIRTNNIFEAVNISTQQIMGGLNTVNQSVFRQGTMIRGAIHAQTAKITKLSDQTDELVTQMQELVEYLDKKKYDDLERAQEAGGRRGGLAPTGGSMVKGGAGGVGGVGGLLGMADDVLVAGGIAAGGSWVMKKLLAGFIRVFGKEKGLLFLMAIIKKKGMTWVATRLGTKVAGAMGGAAVPGIGWLVTIGITLLAWGDVVDLIEIWNETFPAEAIPVPPRVSEVWKGAGKLLGLGGRADPLSPGGAPIIPDRMVYRPPVVINPRVEALRPRAEDPAAKPVEKHTYYTILAKDYSVKADKIVFDAPKIEFTGKVSLGGDRGPALSPGGMPGPGGGVPMVPGMGLYSPPGSVPYIPPSPSTPGRMGAVPGDRGMGRALPKFRVSPGGGGAGAVDPHGHGDEMVTDMPPNVRDLAKKWGLGWGGDWKSKKDPMHFSAAKGEGGTFDVDRNSRPELTWVTSKSGQKFQVAKEYAKNFEGFVNDLEDQGYKIRSAGGYSDRSIAGSGRRSYHGAGASIDINPEQNPVQSGRRRWSGEGKVEGPVGTPRASVKTGKFEDPKTSSKIDPAILKKYEGRRMPVSIRNNNMGAISLGRKNSWVEELPGYIGKTARPANEGGYYAKFATPEHGINGASELLKRYGSRGINTANAIVRKWSTDSSAWGNYAALISKYTGKSPSEPLDLNDPQVRMAVLQAQSAHESGTGRPVYSPEVFQRGVSGAFDAEKNLSRGRGGGTAAAHARSVTGRGMTRGGATDPSLWKDPRSVSHGGSAMNPDLWKEPVTPGSARAPGSFGHGGGVGGAFDPSSDSPFVKKELDRYVEMMKGKISPENLARGREQYRQALLRTETGAAAKRVTTPKERFDAAFESKPKGMKESYNQWALGGHLDNYIKKQTAATGSTPVDRGRLLDQKAVGGLVKELKEMKKGKGGRADDDDDSGPLRRRRRRRPMPSFSSNLRGYFGHDMADTSGPKPVSGSLVAPGL